MFAQSIDFDQVQHQQQDTAIEELYIEEVSDGFVSKKLITTEIINLHRYCQSMKQIKRIDLSINLTLIQDRRSYLRLMQQEQNQ